MGARDYMFPLLHDKTIMARVHEARDRFLDFRAFWADRYTETIDFTHLDDFFNSFELRARNNFERMCDDCIFTVTNGTSVHNPYRESRRKRQEDGYDRHGKKVQYARNGLFDSGPDHLCLECENDWLDELNYGWDLYCTKRLDCIVWGVPQDKPLDYIQCQRLPGGKYMWYNYAIPGYTNQQAREKKNQSTSAFLEELDKKKEIRKEVEEKYKKNYIHDYIRKELLWHEIKYFLTEHIIEDGKKLELWKAGSEDRSKQVRAEIRAEFLSKTLELYGEAVLDKISQSDITEYCNQVEAGGDANDLWYSVFTKYDFDQNTDSCLYFIKQGPATKIGITNSLNSRFAQIKTSAALPCEIANVVYTHWGYRMEQTLHQRLKRFNSNLEWFIFPPEIENRLFKAKCVDDIEEFLKWLENANEHLFS